MKPPVDVAQGTVLEVKGRSIASGLFVNEGFELGPYEVAKVDRNWTSTSSHDVGSYASSTTKTGYSFALRGGKAEWRGACSVYLAQQSMSLGTLVALGTRKSSLDCQCTGGEKPGRLELRAGTDGEYAGTLYPTAEKGYAIKQVQETDGSYFGGPAGYRIDGDDGARGAVEVLHPGRIWFTDRTPENEREPSACLLAGLMLFREPREP